MSTPAIIWLILSIMGVAASALVAVIQRLQNSSKWANKLQDVDAITVKTKFNSRLVMAAFSVFLYIWGGFLTWPLTIPATIYVVIEFMRLGRAAYADGETRELRYPFTKSLIQFTFWAGLLYWGGFFS